MRSIILLMLLPCLLTAQGKPDLAAHRTERAPKIDGILDEAEWADADAATDFITLRPNPGFPSSQPTEVKVLYGNLGLYVGAQLYDSAPDSILSELTERDDLGNTDFFGLVLDPYQSGLNGFTFIVTPDNVQFDAKQSVEQGEDENWDAVWQSSTSRSAEGWSAEIFLPYSALRFPSTSEQTWTVNFVRMLRRANQQSFWSEIDPNVDGFLNQSGSLSGLYDIKSPPRIQATPFVAVYGLKGKSSGQPADFGTSVTGGMDLKVGLSDAFTLDMTLIPDFGEARSDDQILNLGPFEQRFDEQRAFFTEGTELFNKGGLFYSRRVGGSIYDRGAAERSMTAGETIVDNPSRAQLYNATKISGRTASGTGIGFFNAVEQASYATIRNGEGEERRVETNPLTNYNVTVIDQNLPNNSSATLINTNVLREGAARDANVTGVLFDLHNKANVYALRGNFTHSRQYDPGELITGHALDLEFARISGKWQYEVGYREESDTYDVNDLGIIFANNERRYTGFVRYNQPEPFFGGKFLNGGAGMFFSYDQLYQPSVFTESNLELWVYGQTKGFWNVNFWTDHTLGSEYDYFEPRVDGRYWRSGGYNNVGGWIGSDSRKRLRVSSNFNFNRWRQSEPRHSVNGNVNVRYRFSDRLSLQAFAWKGLQYGDIGYVNQSTRIGGGGNEVTDVFFGTRDRSSVEAGISGKYSFNANMVLNLRIRHYWSGVAYDQFHLLGDEGDLRKTDYDDNHDQDFDAFNVDLIYRWRFLPGSDIFVVYKSNVTDFDRQKAGGWSDSFSQLWRDDTPRQSSISLKVIYWLDYASLFPS